MLSKFENANDAINFIGGGNAVFTLESKRTGKRYTYRTRKSKDAGDGSSLLFVDVLTGPDNTSDYQYIGTYWPHDGKGLNAGKKGNPHHPAFAALDWLLMCLRSNHFPGTLNMWHEGRCGRCGRLLTTPESIESGFGPECIKKVAA